MVRKVTEDELTYNSTNKNNRGDILDGVGLSVSLTVQLGETGRDRGDRVVNVTVREQTGTSSDDGPVLL